MSGDTTLSVGNVSLNTAVTDRIPVLARFTISGETAVNTVHTVTGRTPTDALVTDTQATTAITFTPPLSAGTYADILAGATSDATENVTGTPIVNEVQTLAPFASLPTGGTYTLTLTLAGSGANNQNLDGETLGASIQYTTGTIVYNAAASVVQTAVDTALASYVSPTSHAYQPGDVAVTGGPLTTTALTLTFSGASVELTPQGLTYVNGSALTGAPGSGATGAAAQLAAGGASVDAVQKLSAYTSIVTGGTFTLTLTLAGHAPYTTGNIAYNATHSAIQTAVDTALTAYTNPTSVAYTAGDVSVTGGPLTTAALTITFSGASVSDLAQGQTVLNGQLLTGFGYADNGVLTFIPIALVIKVGDGDLKYTENHSYKYDLDRGILDTVRIGDDIPLDLTASFTYEHITT
jgi:hypothetical protein